MSWMLQMVREYLKREDGAVTVDWVVLTASIVGLGLAVIVVVTDGAINQSGSVGNWLESLSVGDNANP